MTLRATPVLVKATSTRHLLRVAREPAANIPPGYDPRAYPPVAVTVDVAVLTLHEGRLHVLLIQRGREPWLGAWALPGGFVRPNETLDEAAARELREETGVDASAHLEQLHAYGDPGRDPRMRVVTVAYLAVLPDIPDVSAGTDAARAELVPVDDLLGPTAARRLAFDHELILADAVDRAREQLSSTSLATAFVGPEFTLGRLREVYEAAWGVDLDPGNFRRKVLSTEGFVEPTGRRAPPGPEGGKPAETYRSMARARLNPPLQPPGVEMHASLSLEDRALSDVDLERAMVWRVWISEDEAFQRALLDGGLVTPVARWEASIPDEEWDAFRGGMQLGDLVLAPLAREQVAIGEVASPILERPHARDRRMREVREVHWLAELPRKRLPRDIRRRLDAAGALTPLRVSAAARRLRRLLDA